MSAVRDVPELQLRPMRPTDLTTVMTVETRAYTHPWTENIFRDCLRVGYQCWVLEIAEQLSGYAVLTVAVGEAHLLNLCIDPERQGQGFGRRLLQRMLGMAEELQADTVFLEVRESNTAARALYESMGFCQVGLRRDYYPAAKGQEDAVIYAKTL